MTVASFAQLVRHHAAERSNANALTYGAKRLTFADLDARSNRVAQALSAEGVQPYDRVAYLDKNTPEFFELLFGASKLNAVVVPVNWRLAAPEVAYIVRHATAKVFVVGSEFRELVREVESELDEKTRIIVLSPGSDDDYERWLLSAPSVDPGANPVADDVALQLYTSGTTGLPKGVMLTNRNLFSDLLPIAADEWSFDPRSVNLVAMPVFHVAGTGYAAVGLLVGCETVLLREVDPTVILQTIERAKVTNFLAVPAVLQQMLAVEGVEGIAYSSLRCIVYGASPISDAVLSHAIATFGCGFIQAYGLTETAGAVVTLMPEDHDPDGPRAHLLRAAGRPIRGVELRIVSADATDVLTGSVGEIWVRSSQTMKGYWRQPEETAKAITPDGWFRTGDAGFVDEDGYLYIHDRVKDMIIAGGENIYPAEIENALMAHPRVSDVAVIGVPDERWGEAVKAVVVPDRSASVTEAELIAHARERLARFKCPSSVEFVSELPRNPSGKVLKRELRAPYWIGHDREVN